MERQPVVNRAFVVAAVGLLVAALGKAGVVVPEDVAGNLIEVAAVLAPLALAYWARRHVTPVKDPRDADGNRLLSSGGPVPQGITVTVGESADPAAGRQIVEALREYEK